MENTANMSTESNDISIEKLRSLIPKKCFERSTVISLSYLLRDVIYVTVLAFLACQIDHLPSTTLRVLAWLSYGIVQGFSATGLWILGHECGHGAFSQNSVLNNTVGLIVHSFLLVPYFSWKITHARHHQFVGHMDKDTAFVPPRQDEFDAKREKTGGANVLFTSTEDAPLFSLVKLLIQQVLGWPLYFLFNSSAGSKSLPHKSGHASSWGHSHYSPLSGIFLPRQIPQVLISDAGLIAMGTILFLLSQSLGWTKVALLYFMPYIWVNHWLIAITFLHHTDPAIPHYGPMEWSFLKGALGTADRDFGFVGRHFFHNIIDHHVVHHLFPKIPFYRACAATEAIAPLLGTRYVNRKSSSFLGSLYYIFRSCVYVTPRRNVDGSKSDVWLWSRG